MQFENRKDAALQLIPYLNKYKNNKSIVLAVPRGGVPLAFYIAQHYKFPLELLMTKKIGHPNNPEFAIGAVSLEDVTLDKVPMIPWSYLEEKIKTIRKNLQEKYKLFMGDHKPLNLEGKVIIIVDDGMATGNTLLSSIAMLRKRKPAKIVVAIPVASSSAALRLKPLVDDFICPFIPDSFVGVGYHYADFSEVSDEEVIKLLKQAREVNKI